MVEAYEVQSTLSVKDELNAALAKAIEQSRTLSKVLRDVEAATGGAFSRAARGATSATGSGRAASTGGGATAARAASSSLGPGLAAGFAAAAAQAERFDRATALAIHNVQELRTLAARPMPAPGGRGGLPKSPEWQPVGRVPAGLLPAPTTSAVTKLPPIWRPAALPAPAAGGDGDGGGIPPGVSAGFGESGRGHGGYSPMINNTIRPGGAGGGGGVPPTGSFPLGAGGAGGGGGHLTNVVDGYILMQAGEIGTRFGEGMLAALGKTLAAGGSYQHESDMLSILLGSPTNAAAAAKKAADLQTAQTAAYATSMALPMTSLTGNLKAISEMYSIFGNMNEAAAMLKPVEQYSIVSGALMPSRKTDAYTALRSAEMLGWTTNPKTGAIDPTRTTQFLGIMERAEVATAGRVDERQFFNFAQQASLAAKNMTAQGLMMMVPVINELGGARAGTALQSINQQIVGGVMPQRIVADWEKLTGANGKPLLDPTKVTATRTGVRAGPGAIQGSDLLQQNPIAWIETNLIPAMQKAGMTRTQMVPEIERLFSRSTSQREAGVIATQMLQIQKDYSVEMATMPTQQAVTSLTGGDFETNLAAMTGAWTNFETVLGKTALPIVVPALQGITKGIVGLTSAVVAHPEMAKILLGTGAALGGLAIAAGSALVTIGALRLALEGIAGLRGGLGLASAVQAAGVDGVLGGLAAVASPIGAAIGAGFLAYIGLKGLDGLITGSAPPNTGAPRTGYHQANEHKPMVLRQIQALPPAPDGVRHDGVGRGVNPELHKAAVALQHAADAMSKGPGNVTVHLDGKKVAEVVVGHMTDTMKRPNRGKSSFDNRSTPALPSHAVALRG